MVASLIDLQPATCKVARGSVLLIRYAVRETAAGFIEACVGDNSILLVEMSFKVFVCQNSEEFFFLHV